MKNYIKNSIEYIRLKKDNENQNNNDSDFGPGTKVNIPKTIEEAKKIIKDSFIECSDFIIREVSFGEQKIKIVICYIDGLVDKNILNRDIINPIQSFKGYPKNILVVLRNDVISNSAVEEITDMREVIDEILCGSAMLLVEDEKTALKIAVRNDKGRSVEEPTTEVVIRGPREGFVENMGVNTALIRRKVKDVNLKLETFRVGSRTKTDVAICYLKGVAKDEIVAEVKKRLKKIKADAILESGYIEQFIEDSPLSIFGTMTTTQKPDIAAARILEGRVAILIDGTPHVLTVPHLFIENLQTSEDYYIRPYMGTFLRMLRLLAFAISVFAPGLYVALTTYHQEMIPTVLLITIAEAREGVPFPAMIEAFIMILSFELLRESGIRLPRAIGSAISIVGALIIGQAAVEAGIVGAMTVIVVAVTGVSSFIIPTLAEAMLVYRFIFLILGGTMGLFGIICGLFIASAHLVSMNSFGIPYTGTFAPVRFNNLKDSLIRLPLWTMKRRPINITDENKKRLDNKRGNNS